MRAWLILFGALFLGPNAGSAEAFRGKPISIEATELKLSNFFSLIGELSGLNIVLDPAVQGTITLRLHNVPWDQVLELVLREKRLFKHREGTVLYILPVEKAPKFFER